MTNMTEERTMVHHYVSTLSDGSKIHDIAITQGEQTVTLHAVTEEDADALMAELVKLIKNHTVDTP